MKIPSLVKLPNHQRFYIKPRYYDPIKEEVEHRERLLIAEINAEKKKGVYTPGTRIATAFKRGVVKKDDSGMIRLLIVILLFGGTIAYMFYGSIALYSAFAVIGLIFVIKKVKQT